MISSTQQISFNQDNSKFQSNKSSQTIHSPALVPQHPLGVRPLGNQYSSSSNSRNNAGFFQGFPEEILVILLESFNYLLLLVVGSTCKYLHAFSRLDTLWKTIFVKSQKSNDFPFMWLGTWRSTFLNLRANLTSKPRCDNVFSDVLYQPFLCAHISLGKYASSIPPANSIVRHTNLSLGEFSKNWGNKPFILTHPVKEWPIFKSWNFDHMHKQYGHVKFRAEDVKWRFDDYYAYMKNNSDESPLYLFDKSFHKKMDLETNHLGSSYKVPECFDDDLFSLLGDQRPDYQWLIIGPERSGSTFHKDPNATSAWNAVLRGCKYWIMFPTTVSFSSPPGVFVSQDESEVTSPLSIAEWLLAFHAEAQKLPECVECLCREGEILYVPSGWWHLVVNLEPTIAITQNFVPRIHLPKVLAFLKEKPDQISGFKKDVVDPYRLFVERIQVENPDLLESSIDEKKLQAPNRKRKWDIIVGSREDTQAFTFDFKDINCDDNVDHDTSE